MHGGAGGGVVDRGGGVEDGNEKAATAIESDG
jgi:hypothetical protein